MKRIAFVIIAVCFLFPELVFAKGGGFGSLMRERINEAYRAGYSTGYNEGYAVAISTLATPGTIIIIVAALLLGIALGRQFSKKTN